MNSARNPLEKQKNASSRSKKKKKKNSETQMRVCFNCTQMDTKSIEQTRITIEVDSSYEKKSWNYNNKNKNRLT